MALSPRELIQQQIRRKTAKTKEIRAKQAERLNPEERIFRFLNDFDQAYKTASTDIEKAMLIESESSTLLRDLHLVDPFARIELVWFGNSEGSMRDIRIEGVKVTWSDAYRISHKLDSNDQLFDLSDLLFR